MFYVIDFHITYFERQNMLIRNKVFPTLEVYIRGFIVELEKLLICASKNFNSHIQNFIFEYGKLSTTYANS